MAENAPRPTGAGQPETFPSEHLRDCDLVMKGGLTSGVVYPAAILELAKQHRFVSIGGASAGAIAAATAAAAEYGRQTKPDDREAGFYALRKLQLELAREGFVASLFQPAETARPLFDTLMGLKRDRDAKARAQRASGAPPLETSALRKVLDFAATLERTLQAHASQGFHRGELLGLLAALGIYAVIAGPVLLASLLTGGAAANGAGPTIGLVAEVVGLLFAFVFLLVFPAGLFLGGLLGGGGELKQAFAFVNSRASFFGLCTGSGEPGAAPEPLIHWLSRQLNELAGKDPHGPPLTCGQLLAKRITFQMVTTDLSKAQPMVMPWSDETFLFKEDEFRRLFPDPVVDHLVRRGRQRTARNPVKLPPGFYLFPAGEDLPVIVATRMSLSFPVLLSAVPLYTLKAGAYAEARQAGHDHVVRPELVQEHWFSDGGIANNFPLSLFDSWLPDRPTFGITLGDSPFAGEHFKLPRPPRPGELDDDAVARGEGFEELRDSVLMLRPRDIADTKRLLPSHEITGLANFMTALFDTARNYRDNTQSVLPSYRERVAMVFLDPGEGGLNLDMSAATIGRIIRKGEYAAHLINQFDFTEHQWVRLLVLMSQLENALNQMRIGTNGPKSVEELRAGLASVLDAMVASHGRRAFYKAVHDPEHPGATAPAHQGSEAPPHRLDSSGWVAQATKRLDALLALMKAWEGAEAEWRQRHPTARHGDGTESYTFFRRNRPRPEASLRVTPEL